MADLIHAFWGEARTRNIELPLQQHCASRVERQEPQGQLLSWELWAFIDD